jgi:hypothetical protein
MTSRLRRVELLGAALVAVIGLALAAVALRSSSAPAPSHPSRSARPTALAFGRSYLAFLGGSGSSAALAGATVQVRAIAASGGRLPARDRLGALRLSSLRLTAVSGAPQGNAILAGANRRLSLKAAIGLSYVDGRWRVSSLVAPDLDTLLARAKRLRVPSALRAVATQFVVAYADYRAGSGPRPTGLETPIARQISARRDPLAGSRAGSGHARLDSLQIVPQGALASVAATLQTGGRRLHVSVVMRHADGLWRPWDFLEAAS